MAPHVRSSTEYAWIPAEFARTHNSEHKAPKDKIVNCGSNGRHKNALVVHADPFKKRCPQRAHRLRTWQRRVELCSSSPASIISRSSKQESFLCVALIIS